MEKNSGFATKQIHTGKIEIPGIAPLATPNTNEHTVTMTGDVTATAEPRFPSAPMPAWKKTMARAAPKAAPWLTPSVEAEASGFRRTFCITAPAKARLAPTTAAVAILGKRML